MNRIAKHFITLALCSLVASPALAGPTVGSENNGKSTPTPFPKSGTLSGSYSGGPGKIGVDGNWGGRSEIESNAPISGSVSKISGNNWKMKIFNSSNDSYSVDVSVVQLASDGSKNKEDHYSYNLGPSKSQERSISALAHTVSCSLKLNSWKKTGSAKSAALPASAPGAVAGTADDNSSESRVPEKRE